MKTDLQKTGGSRIKKKSSLSDVKNVLTKKRSREEYG